MLVTNIYDYPFLLKFLCYYSFLNRDIVFFIFLEIIIFKLGPSSTQPLNYHSKTGFARHRGTATSVTSILLNYDNFVSIKAIYAAPRDQYSPRQPSKNKLQLYGIRIKIVCYSSALLPVFS